MAFVVIISFIRAIRGTIIIVIVIVILVVIIINSLASDTGLLPDT